MIEMKMQNFNSFGKKKCENLRNKWVNEEISGRCCLSFCLRLFDQWALLFVQSCNNVMQSKDAGVALLCGFVFSDLRLFNEWTQGHQELSGKSDENKSFKSNQLAPSIYIMIELCFFSLDQ